MYPKTNTHVYSPYVHVYMETWSILKGVNVLWVFTSNCLNVLTFFRWVYFRQVLFCIVHFSWMINIVYVQKIIMSLCNYYTKLLDEYIVHESVNAYLWLFLGDLWYILCGLMACIIPRCTIMNRDHHDMRIKFDKSLVVVVNHYSLNDSSFMAPEGNALSGVVISHREN